MPQLVPFSLESGIPQLQLQGDLRLLDEGLEIQFLLNDPNKQLADSLQMGRWDSYRLKRADELWKSTCFEVFFAQHGSPGYWELNLSAQGLWNLYRFEDYRSPQPPTAATDFELIFVETDPGHLRALLHPVDPLVGKIEASLCSVLRKNSDEVFYYALHHAGSKPDFHLRQSFCLSLTPKGHP